MWRQDWLRPWCWVAMYAVHACGLWRRREAVSRGGGAVAHAGGVHNTCMVSVAAVAWEG